ncbi:uncharacterized protein TNCV_564471 [Trichonephila clavipes]|nr:uncharacterized protein TNCV_564471 [Trichonephila clavipes]
MLTVNVDQVRIYRHRKCDEMEIRTGSSDSNSSRHKSSSFESVQRRSNESQYGRKKGSGVKRELEEKGITFFKERSGTREEAAEEAKNNQGEKRHLTLTSNSELQGRRKKYRGDEIVMPSTSGYNLRPRRGAKVESLPTIEMKTQQEGPV